MKFKSISFHQYRCFLDGTIDFYGSKDHNKSITLIEAPNGSGKTELLFAFWWVLYEFDFKMLINKEDTPYALNSRLYREVLNGSIGGKEQCSVKLVFEHEGITYTIQRTEYYEKGSSRRQLRVTQEVEFSTTDENGVSEPPIRKNEEVKKRLERIIPQRVLNGIIFDGERMQRISSAEQKSIESIQGVINDVTNKDFIEFCLESILDVLREYNAELRRVANAGGNTQLTRITNDMDKLNSEITNLKNTKEAFEKKEQELENRRVIVTDLLKSSEETRKNIFKLEAKVSEKKASIKQLSDKIEDLYGELGKFGYSLALEKLLNETEKLISTYNIPTGLTVNAVEQIMQRDRCICGTPFDEKMIETLKELRKLLPPDNLNAVLKEEIISLNNRTNETKGNLQRIWRDIKDAEKRIKNCQSDIEILSKDISDVSDDSKALEEERESIDRQLGKISSDLKLLPTRIEKAENSYEALLREKKRIAKNIGIEVSLNRKCDFLEKCRKALIMLQERYRTSALNEINEYLQNAYKEIAEDYEDGRQVYITRFIGKSYRIINYYTKHVEEFLHNADWTSIATSNNIKLSDMTDDIRREIAILENAVSKSTGQSKSVTIAFVKAILDYSSIDKIDDEFQIKKEYPLVIDAPFSDLSGENLIRPAEKLNTFSEQVILLLTPDNYDSVKEYIDQHIGLRYKISKQKDMNCSIISKGE